ncbi:hypothetical protein ACSIGC_13305 [Tenacibaculum sp. ZS6-P6]|uniref:hypothetical protein n=1 Tax=Tenacibaculum sp. ZS6-P6 TaxID=3447503 RepID=UPI003F97F8B2
MNSNFLYIIFVSVALFLTSCQNTGDTTIVTTPVNLQANLSECFWSPFSQGANFILSIDFSNNNVVVYNSDKEMVDKGNWAFIEGKFVLSNLGYVLANYNGVWEIIINKETFFELQKEGVKINFEQDCSSNKKSY